MLKDPYIEVAIQAPPSPDYIPGPEELEQAPPSPDYVPGPEHANDEIVVEDQPYAEDTSPTAQPPEYVPESDLEAHPEDNDDEDSEEDPVDYPADGGDDDDDEEGLIRSLGYRAAMIRLRAKAASTFHSPPLPPPFILSPTRSDAPSSGTPLLVPISASTSSPPLQLPSASRREDRPEVTLPPWKRLAGGLRADYGFVATMDKEIMRDPEREVGYGITDSWDEIVETLQGAPVSTDTELGGYMREFETRVRQDSEEIYMRLDDEQSERQLLAGRLNMLFRDRRAHAYTRHLMETKARMSRESWVRSTDASDLVCGEVMSLRTTVLGQMTEIRELHAADRRRQTMISELLRADHRRSIEIIELRTALQRQVTALQGQVTALQAQKQMAPKRTTRSTADQETINATLITNAQLQAMIDQGVTAALAACDALRSTNGDGSHNSGTGVRRTKRATHECTYTDFLKCQPLPFKGTEGVASLSQWCKRMESVFHISNCATVGHDAAYGMPWKTLMKMMTGKYCPRNEIKKLEMELWDLKGNQGVRNNAPARVYAVGRAGADPDANVVTANGRIIGLNTILRSCTLNLLNHPFNIDLMPVELGSFDAIISMDWLAKYQAIIMCAEKIFRIPWGNEILIIHGDGSNRGNATRLSIISCTKTEKYVKKGFPKDKSKEKRLEDVP
nr:reverse transcriptase domain-containing protein [Tanacetum cinerariifolium]